MDQYNQQIVEKLMLWQVEVCLVSTFADRWESRGKCWGVLTAVNLQIKFRSHLSSSKYMSSAILSRMAQMPDSVHQVVRELLLRGQH